MLCVCVRLLANVSIIIRFDNFQDIHALSWLQHLTHDRKKAAIQRNCIKKPLFSLCVLRNWYFRCEWVHATLRRWIVLCAGYYAQLLLGYQVNTRTFASEVRAAAICQTVILVPSGNWLTRNMRARAQRKNSAIKNKKCSNRSRFTGHSQWSEIDCSHIRTPSYIIIHKQITAKSGERNKKHTPLIFVLS